MRHDTIDTRSPEERALFDRRREASERYGKARWAAAVESGTTMLVLSADQVAAYQRALAPHKEEYHRAMDIYREEKAKLSRRSVAQPS